MLLLPDSLMQKLPLSSLAIVNRIIYDAALLCYDFFGDYQQRKIETIEETESVSNKEQLIKETKGKKRK